MDAADVLHFDVAHIIDEMGDDGIDVLVGEEVVLAADERELDLPRILHIPADLRRQSLWEDLVLA